MNHDLRFLARRRWWVEVGLTLLIGVAIIYILAQTTSYDWTLVVALYQAAIIGVRTAQLNRAGDADDS